MWSHVGIYLMWLGDQDTPVATLAIGDQKCLGDSRV